MSAPIRPLLPPAEVKVYLWMGECMECGGNPYFSEQPLASMGDFRRLSEEHARTIPAATLARWKAAAGAWEAVQDEIDDLLEGKGS